MLLTVGLAGSGADRIVTGTAEDEINQAFADVGAAGGGSVTLLQGTFSLASGLWVTSDNITFNGAGVGQSILQASPTYSGSSAMVQFQEVDNFSVQDITFDGHTNAILTNGIMAIECTNSTIKDCEVLLSENHNYGIWIVLSDGMQILDNRINGFVKAVGQEGIESWSSNNVLISGNTITNVGGAGLNLLSYPTPSYEDIEGDTINVKAINNTVLNAYIGASVEVVGPRSFGHIDVQDNTFTTVAYGVRLSTHDRASGAPASESATIENPQSLHDVTISNNQINLFSQSGSGILLDNASSAGVVTFSNITASNNVIADAPSQPFGVFNFDHFALDGNIITSASTYIHGSSYNDIIRGNGFNTLDYSSATQSVVVDLPSKIAIGAEIGTDTLLNIMNVKTGSGNDTVAGYGGANVLDGGAGIDTLSYYKASSGVVIDLASNVAVQGGVTGTILNFENANGSSFNDAMAGTAGPNILDGLGGIDSLSFYKNPRGLTIDLTGTVVVDGAVTDIVRNFENVNATSYNDSVSGDFGANVLDGLGGIDTVSYYASWQSVTVNLSAGTAISGGITDTLRNFENVNGSSFGDVIIGDGGANTLNGLGGADTLTGGGGFDVFEFWAGNASGDVITDFTGNGASPGDTIKLAGFGTAAQGATITQIDATQWQIHSGLDGHDEIIKLSNGATIHGSDFFFV